MFAFGFAFFYIEMFCVLLESILLQFVILHNRPGELVQHYAHTLFA